MREIENRLTAGPPWLALCFALAVHVWDEAAHDFLSLYNPNVERLREAIPILPIPTFTFGVWLAGLIVVIAALSVLSLPAWRNNRWVLRAAYVFAGIMFANGLWHTLGSVIAGRWLPGVISSPLLLVASAWLFVRVRSVRRVLSSGF